MTARTVASSALLFAGLALIACNDITGASSIELDPEFTGSSSTGYGGASGTSQVGVTSGGPEGSGTSVTSTVASTSVSSSVAASSVAASSVAASSVAASSVAASSVAASSVAASSVAASSATGGPAPWPVGPYGVATGKTIPEKLSFDGYLAGSNQAGTIALKDWYDPDGSKGIHAILVILSQFGCGPCYQEAKTLESEIAGWKSQGLEIKVLQLVINDSGGGDADIGSAGQWKQQFSLINVSVGADPDWKFAASSSFGTPQNTIVNPRTMKVVSVTEGFSGNYSKLESLAQSNL